MSLLGHVSILVSKLSHCPNTDTSLCYCNYPFLTVKWSSTLHSHDELVCSPLFNGKPLRLPSQPGQQWWCTVIGNLSEVTSVEIHSITLTAELSNLSPTKAHASTLHQCNGWNVRVTCYGCLFVFQNPGVLLVRGGKQLQKSHFPTWRAGQIWERDWTLVLIKPA